ncbi:uncharacterized protein BX663DRAFT_189985 [Cokeromyces recurvatus]|uniref:uncharacterized protein n=1 Tax=Cokeromyces recurvatus TaxID=90255 RepID=UPI00221EC20B|nr:uncharacterized protein BX663DRAFT_189985 [Cokeromyces recurvatus]KAI7906348.1 hypothetical protein BX663DRAFT_189985 [Cokeromyces recurvatus]
MKAEAALPKRTRFINNKNTFIISGNNSNIRSIQLGDRYGTDESSSSNMGVKRKFNSDLEERNNNKKPNIFEVEEGIKENNSILEKWDKFLENKESFHLYSPEYHRIIRGEKIVSSKPFLDKDLYNQHINEHKDVEYVIPEACMPYIANVIKQDDLDSYRKAIRAVPEANNEDENALLFIENLFQTMYIFHTAHQDIYEGESTFNGLFLYPFLKAVARAVSKELNSTKTDFCDGEVCLESMSIQLKSLNMMVDNRNMYKADGVIRMYGFKRLEISFSSRPHIILYPLISENPKLIIIKACLALWPC